MTERLADYERVLLEGDPALVKGFWTEDARVLLPGVDLDGAGVAVFVEELHAGGSEVVSVEFQTADARPRALPRTGARPAYASKRRWNPLFACRSSRSTGEAGCGSRYWSEKAFSARRTGPNVWAASR